MTHESGLRSLLAGSVAVVLGITMSFAGHPFGNVWAAEPIKVGILHSLSGTMAISETPIKEVVLMAIDEINKAGGVLGRPVEPIIEDPASNWDLFAEKSKKLLQQDKVATVFGCWTSVSRKYSSRCSSNITVCCSIRSSMRARSVPRMLSIPGPRSMSRRHRR